MCGRQPLPKRRYISIARYPGAIQTSGDEVASLSLFLILDTCKKFPYRLGKGAIVTDAALIVQCESCST